MEVMPPEDFFELNTEDVIVICKSNKLIFALAVVEYWEDCPTPLKNDAYRINYFERDRLGQDWILNNSTIQMKGIIGALVDKCSEQCGGIYFAHEEERHEKNVFEELFKKHIQYNPKIFKISMCESK